mmetsp:Transcript_1760/g.2669  ORF Transcript_1760/g.2669 Transcript_1760/m.2669 type:complete len:207 (+) Transcript_1760:383-1003(+)
MMKKKERKKEKHLGQWNRLHLEIIQLLMQVRVPSKKWVSWTTFSLRGLPTPKIISPPASPHILFLQPLFPLISVLRSISPLLAPPPRPPLLPTFSRLLQTHLLVLLLRLLKRKVLVWGKHLRKKEVLKPSSLRSAKVPKKTIKQEKNNLLLPPALQDKIPPFSPLLPLVPALSPPILPSCRGKNYKKPKNHPIYMLTTKEQVERVL